MFHLCCRASENLELFVASRACISLLDSLAGKSLSTRGFTSLKKGQSLTLTQAETFAKEFSLEYNVMQDMYWRGGKPGPGAQTFGWWRLVKDCEGIVRREDSASKKVYLARSSKQGYITYAIVRRRHRHNCT